MSPLAKIFAASTDPALAESGGAHNQKGVDFQRYWAILRALTLEQEGATDFVLLFESVQDVLELDSEHDPSRAREHVGKYAVELVQAHYSDFGPTLAVEMLAEKHGIRWARETLRRWMIV
jgi:hypothetical protein